jgi:tail tube protein
MANPYTEALSSMGTALLRNSVEIAEVTNIGGPSWSAETVEATHLRSPGFWKEYIGSLKDGGDLTFDINMLLDNPTHMAAAGILSAFAGDTQPPTDDWSIVFPDDAATTWSFKGITSGFETGAETGGKLEASVTVKITGKPTLS